MHDGSLIEDDFDPEVGSGPRPPRPPRRPFSIGGLHWIGWVFLLFALGDLAWFVVNADQPATATVWDYLFYAFQIIPAVVAVLFPVVLLARHPDAPTRTPLLLLGVLLFALVQGLLILASRLQPVFETLSPPSDDVPFLVPLAAIFGGLTLLIGVIGLALAGRGLSNARRYEDGGPALTAPLVAVATIFATVVGIIAATRLSIPDGPIPASYLIYLVSTIILGILRVAVWTYLLTTTLGGWLAREEPRGGWVIATLGATAVLAALVLVNLAGVLDIQDATFVTAYGWLITILYAFGHLDLLLAFAIGLPKVDRFQDDEDEDDGDEDDEDEDEDDDDPGEFADERVR
jgi:hypothetical protein